MADILLGNVKGPQGDTGATGSQGPHGDAATITVGTVSTTAYGNTAQVINSGTEQDAVLDFVIPQGKPGEQTTRMGALTLDTITAQSADFPIPAVGETGSTVFGKIIKFFNSTISALNSKLNISDVVNNLTSTSTTQPLSAAQGKALNDAIATGLYFNADYIQQMTMDVSYTTRMLVKFQHLIIFEIVLPSCAAGLIKICTIPQAVRPNMQVSLSVACETSTARAGRQEALVNVGGVVYLYRENASTGPISVSGCWYRS